MNDSSGGRLLVGVLTAGAAATLRMQVWRKLRSLGALYLQQSVCLPPARDDVVREVLARARGRTTYAEVEECEADLERYRSWLAKIAARDYFGAPGAAADPYSSARQRKQEPGRQELAGAFTEPLQLPLIAVAVQSAAFGDLRAAIATGR